MTTKNETNKNLPTLAELHHDVGVAFKNDQLNLLLNQPPPDSWIKDHPFAKNVKYLPIDKVELMLTRIFQVWKVEILREGALFNSVYVTIRLHYLNPISGEMEFHDGVGAVGVQTDKGESASNLAAIKQDAIMKALPAAVSYAIKDAAEHLGDLFGRNLNRKDTIAFNGSYNVANEISKNKQVVEITQEVEHSILISETNEHLTNIYNNNADLHSNPKFMEMLNRRKNEIKVQQKTQTSQTA